MRIYSESMIKYFELLAFLGSFGGLESEKVVNANQTLSEFNCILRVLEFEFVMYLYQNWT